MQLSNALRARLPQSLKSAAAPALVALLTLGLLINVVVSVPPAGKAARIEAARWLAERAAPAVVASQRSREAFATGADRYLHFPQSTDAQATIDRLREKGAEYAVVEARRLAAEDPASLQGVEVLHRVPYGNGAVLVLRLFD